MTLVSLFLRNFADIPAVKSAFAGIRAVVGALVLDTVVKLGRGVFKRKGAPARLAAMALVVASFALSAVWSVNPVLIVVTAGLLGVAAHLPAAFRGGIGGGTK
jgi:chromate transporter